MRYRLLCGLAVLAALLRRARWRPAAGRSLLCGLAVLAALLLPGGAGQLAPAHNDFRFSILGDRTGSAIPQIYERIWREVDLLHPDFVVTVGDTIEGHNGPQAADEWRDLRRLWQRYSYPLYFTPGNHDIWDQPSRRLYEKETGRPPSYSFNFQGAHFTVLDNSRGPVLGDDQLRFLEQDLKANQDRAPKFVFFHQPFWLVFLGLGSGDFPLHRMARQYGVNYVVSGHGHQLVRFERDGVTYLEVGSSGASIGRGAARGEGLAQGWFYQHVWVTVKGTAAYLTIKQLDGRMFRAEEWQGNRLR